jgi:uncharacterized protein
LSKIQSESLLSLLFFLGIIFISYRMWLFSSIVLIFVTFVYMKKPKVRFFTSIIMVFLVSFILFQLTNNVIGKLDISKEIRILLNRSLLLLIVAGLLISHRINKKDVVIYHQKPIWKASINLPFHTINVFYFWLIGIVSTVLVFIPFTIHQGTEEIQSLFLFAVFFSVINATCEELIWRGILLSTLEKYLSIRYAMIVTSIGFGLIHLAVGMPMMVSLLFSFAGLYYALLVLKSKSLYPAIIHHFFINMGMVLSGWISSGT